MMDLLAMFFFSRNKPRTEMKSIMIINISPHRFIRKEIFKSLSMKMEEFIIIENESPGSSKKARYNFRFY
jgi:hypothetical protein